MSVARVFLTEKLGGFFFHLVIPFKPSVNLESFLFMCVLDVVLMFRVHLGFCFHPKAI